MKIHRIGFLAFTLTSIAALAAANAADINRAPEPFAGGYKDGPVATWAGFYIGLNGGGAWSDQSDKLAIAPRGFGGLSPSGGFGGGQIGYNWQGFLHPHLVLGVEADIQGAGVDGQAIDKDGVAFLSSLDYFGTVRGRLGYAFGPSLLYATGGFAYGGIKNDVFPAVTGVLPFIFNGTATGFTVGGGWEYKVSPAWSVKAEYQFIDLGRNDPVSATPHLGSACPLQVPKCEDDAFHTVRIGLNYHVVPGYEPLK
jgi:outer membrane immunogenic protein